MFLRILTLSSLLAATVALAGTGGQAGRYLEVEDYLGGVFPGGVPEAQTLWVSGDLRDQVEHILGHRFGALRTRYWYDGEASAWILEEIGKELPITIGVTIKDGAILNVRVLEFRESRGWEVRYPFFTDQFTQARLAGEGQLDRKIDGITGATLSVSAVKRTAKVALILHEHIDQAG
ncbi:MAG: FMN-binding protein [Xanthomonadales bacterium]|nr:FMN-binding protein [Gammaproteobacteria bacterium]MBT8054052.1 FMN-binding protein [Gammaproteobacteria bacterium]NND57417.1 FMN-binding protein [Xanthomonadales bacterium]NNK50346.1 FMN-binding protein [Xanthomonadales bacterium]